MGARLRLPRSLEYRVQRFSPMSVQYHRPSRPPLTPPQLVHSEYGHRSVSQPRSSGDSSLVGTVSILLHDLPWSFPHAESLALAIFILNALLFLIFLIMYLLLLRTGY